MSSQPPRENPFKGLRSYQQQDRDRLFGRDLDLILMKDRIFSCRTTLLFAGSGVGKTSFLNAKVIPALEKQYTIILHNRWTGADEAEDAGTDDDRSEFKIWPPAAFGTWLIEFLIDRVWRRRGKLTPQIDSGSVAPPDNQDKLTADVGRVIAQSLRPGEGGERLPELLARFKRSEQASTGAQQKNCILMLDQFEEVFQYHAFEDYFRQFVSDLCHIINNEDYQVRIVFSLREEFLGDLSVFDNRIPDLFNNYYRLRYPEKDQARDIIVQTCQLAEVEPDAEKLDLLIEDLSKIQRGFTHSQDNGATKTTARYVRRNFVPPPYLQIVCDKLWKEQFENATPPKANVSLKSNGAARFLQNYRSDLEGNAEVGESDAQRAVRTFCNEKLSAPFLNKWEQNLAARAFGFLVTRQGAKMAYELHSLARHMDSRVWPLKHTLRKLSHPDVRILRESRGPERSYWFELYHDMYASVVELWKRNYRRETRRRIRVRFVSIAGLLTGLILLPLAFLYWSKWPADYQKTILDYKDQLTTTNLRQDKSFSQAALAYSKLGNTLGYERTANRLWARVWQRRAQLFEASEQRDEALICLLQAAVLAQGSPEEKEYLAESNNLFAQDEDAIRATYCTNCKSFGVSPNGPYVRTVTNNGVVNIWSTADQRPLSTVCFNCDDAIFTDDGNIATVTARKLIDSANQVSAPTQNAPPELRFEAKRQASSSPPFSPTDTQRTDDVFGWTVQVSTIKSEAIVTIGIRRDLDADTALPGKSGPVQFQLKAVNSSPVGYLVAAIVNDELRVWDQDGSSFHRLPLTVSEKQQEPSDFSASFSPDGRYFVTMGTKARLWEVTPEGLSPSQKIKMSSLNRVYFSPDGRYCVTGSDRELALWELSTQKKVFTEHIDFPLSQVGFADQSNKFHVSLENGSTKICDGGTHDCVDQTADRKVSFSVVTADAKYIIRALERSFEKWSVETGKRIGELQCDELDDAAIMDDGLLVLKSGSVIRLWEIPAPKPREAFAAGENEKLVYEGLTSNGETLLTRSQEETPLTRLPYGYQLTSSDYARPSTGSHDSPGSHSTWNVANKAQIATLPLRPIRDDYSISPNGLYAAGVSSESGKTVDLFDLKTSQASHTLAFNDYVYAYAFSPDSKLLAVATVANDISLVDTSSNRITQTFKTNSLVVRIMFAASGNYVLVVTQNSNLNIPIFNIGSRRAPSLEVWSIRSGEKIALNSDLQVPIEAYDTSADDLLLLIQNKRLLIWNLNDRTTIKDEFYSQDAVLGRFSPNGKLIAVADTNGNVDLYETHTGMRGTTIKLGREPKDFLFTDDNNQLIAVTDAWLHHLTINETNLRYSRGILSGTIIPGSLRRLNKPQSDTTQSPAPYFTWFRYHNELLAIHEASFDGKLSRPVLQGTAPGLLDTWTATLGFYIDSLELPARIPH